MGQVRIDIALLAAALEDALARIDAGDEVLVECRGDAVARLVRLSPQSRPSPDSGGDLRDVVRERRKAEPVDSEFIESVMQAHESFNRPIERSPWER
jgi:antitoxin (DNA-binding transcriptional repressor) of toxin-antitoxin stability system